MHGYRFNAADMLHDVHILITLFMHIFMKITLYLPNIFLQLVLPTSYFSSFVKYFINTKFYFLKTKSYPKIGQIYS